MSPQEKLNNSYNEELTYLDSIIKMLNNHVVMNRNMDVNGLDCLGRAYMRREQVLKEQIWAEEGKPLATT